jgi:hypothetical protein
MLYRVSGFSKADEKKKFDMVVEAPDMSRDRPDKIAEKIAANPDICFHWTVNLDNIETDVIKAEPELIGVLLDGDVLDQKFEAARKLARKQRQKQKAS